MGERDGIMVCWQRATDVILREKEVFQAYQSHTK